MHTCSCLWTGPARRRSRHVRATNAEQHLRRRTLHYRRVVADGALYAQPFSEGGNYDGATRMTPFSTVPKRVDGGWLVNGRKIFASLSGSADYYGILCGEARPGRAAVAPRHDVPRGACQRPRRRDRRRLGSARHARHGLAHAAVQGCLRRRRCRPDAARRLLPGDVALAPHVPDLVADLSRPRPGGLRLHGPLSARRDPRPPTAGSGAGRRQSSSRSPRCS